MTLAGDAAHPCIHAALTELRTIIDARTLADCLYSSVDPRQALKAYEAARSAPTAEVVRTNRQQPPDFINTTVEGLVGDKLFDDLDKYISQDQLRKLSENYKRAGGFTLADVTLRRNG